MTGRAVLYVRQSLDVQMGIDRQLDLTRQLADSRGWTVTNVYQDNATSATKVRGAKTGWGKMLAAGEAKEFDVIVAVDLDRLLRTIRDLVTITDLGVRIATVSGEIDMSDAAGLLNASVQVAAAQFEVRRRVERMGRVVSQKRAAGTPFTAMRPFGFERDMVTLRASEAVPLAEAFSRVLRGDSLHSIARWLNEVGVLTPRGNRWSTAQLKKVLLRERNAGRFVVKGVEQSVTAIQPVVDSTIYDRAKALLTAPGRGVTSARKPELNWLSGIMNCGVCHAKMLQKNVSGVGRTYACGEVLSGRAERGQRHVTIGAHIAEAKVKGAFMDWYENNSDMKLATAQDDAELEKIESDLVELAERRAAATDALMEPNADKGRVQKRLADIATEIEKLSTKRAQVMIRANRSLRFELEGGQELTTTRGVQVTAYSRAEVWWASAPIDQRRAVIRDAFSIEVVPGGKGEKRVLVTEF